MLRTLRRPRSLGFLALALGVAACSMECTGRDGAKAAGGDTGGTMIVGTAADASALLPLFGDRSTDVEVSSVLFDRLADLGDDMNVAGDKSFAPRLAKSWDWAKDSLSIAFHLDPKARWHDGQPVTANDVRFSWQLYADSVVGSPARSLITNIDSVSVRDSLTPVFFFKHRAPDQFFEATYQVIPVPQHLLANANRAEMRAAPFARQPVGDGQYRFASWTPGQRLELQADTANYHGRPKLDRIVWTIVPDPAAGTAGLMAGSIDFWEVLAPDQLKEVAKSPDVKSAMYPGLDYAFMLFNLRGPGGRGAHPLFGDRELRRALTMALDRPAMVKNVFDTLAAVPVGPVPRGLKPDTSSLKQLPYDTARAKAVLDSLGWKDANGDGVREKNGKPLEFTLLVPASSSYRRKYAVLIQEQLARVGVKVDLEQLEFNVFNDRQLKRDFDAALGAFHGDPAPGSIRQNWTTAGIAGDGSNYGSYSSPAFDATIDSALTTLDAARSRAYFAHAYQVIDDDAPAVWLYEARFAAGMNKRIHPALMRADGWWVHLADWSIPAGERIDRDRIPLGAKAR